MNAQNLGIDGDAALGGRLGVGNTKDDELMREADLMAERGSNLLTRQAMMIVG